MNCDAVEGDNNMAEDARYARSMALAFFLVCAFGARPGVVSSRALFFAPVAAGVLEAFGKLPRAGVSRPLL